MPFSYWDGVTDEVELHSPSGTIARTPEKVIALAGVHAPEYINYSTLLYIEATTGDLYKFNMLTDTETLVDGTNSYLDLMAVGDVESAYVLRDDGEIWIFNAYTGAFTLDVDSTCPAPSHFVQGAKYVIDTSGAVWYDDGGWTSWGGYNFANYSDSEALGVTTDGKLWSVDLLGNTASQIGSATDWVGLNAEGLAFNTSGEVWRDLNGTPTLASGTYDPIDEAPTYGCAPGADGFISASGKVYYSDGTTLSRLGAFTGVTKCSTAVGGYAGAAGIYSSASSVVEDIGETSSTTDILGVLFTGSVADTSSANDAPALQEAVALSASGAASDTLSHDVAAWLFESAASVDGVQLQAAMLGAIADSVLAQDILRVYLSDLVIEAAAGSVATAADIAAMIIEYAQAADVTLHQGALSAALAEIAAYYDSADSGLLELVVDGAAGADQLSTLYRTYTEAIEAAVASDAAATLAQVLVMVGERGEHTDALTAHQLMSALITEGAMAHITLVIGGEAYTGWVLNTMTGATTEYQGLQFNSLMVIGGRYFGTMEDGLYELTGGDDAGVDIAGYLKSGLLDFVDPQQRLFPDTQKRVDALYLGCSADGEVAVKVVTVEHGQVLERWYGVNAVTEGEKNTRLVLGKGLRARRWMFEIASTELDTFSAVTLYPLQTGRRI